MSTTDDPNERDERDDSPLDPAASPLPAPSLPVTPASPPAGAGREDILIRTEPRGVLGAFDELLKAPQRLPQRGRAGGSARPALFLAVGSLLALALYGAAAGLFQGGGQVAVAALKAPLILGLSLVLCLPSLYIFAALAGTPVSGRMFLQLVAGFAGMIALLLVGLLPISWLFSVSSRSLPFVVWLHLFAWLIAVYFGVRFVSRGLERRGQGAMLTWFLVFLVVSLQVSTFLRPVLWRGKDEGLFERGKMSFFEHLGRVYDIDTKTEESPKAQAAGTEPKGTEPAGTQPAGTEPAGTESAGTEPKGTEPAETEPKATEPAGTKPAGGATPPAAPSARP